MVFIYGRSLFTYALEATLREWTDLELIRHVDEMVPLPADNPALIIAEANGRLPHYLTLHYPTVPILMLDSRLDRITIIHSQQYPIAQMSDLIDCIKQLSISVEPKEAPLTK